MFDGDDCAVDPVEVSVSLLRIQLLEAPARLTGLIKELNNLRFQGGKKEHTTASA